MVRSSCEACWNADLAAEILRCAVMEVIPEGSFMVANRSRSGVSLAWATAFGRRGTGAPCKNGCGALGGLRLG